MAVKITQSPHVHETVVLRIAEGLCSSRQRLSNQIVELAVGALFVAAFIGWERRTRYPRIHHGE